MSKIYTSDGWINIPGLLSYGMPFIFCTGGRGTGKTFGAFDYCISQNIPFLYMRRMKSEVDFLSASELNNPIAPNNELHGWNYTLQKQGNYMCEIVPQTEDGPGKPVGAVISLSTVAKIRGFNGLQYRILIYDEFIPEPHSKRIKEESTAFLNAYETINRNRELFGLPPLVCLCLSNSNRLDNDLYMGLRLVSKVYDMKKRQQEISIMAERKTLLVNMERSPISEKKKETALYQMAAGLDYGAMALDNAYIGDNDTQAAKSRPIREYKPLCNVGELSIYQHKGNGSYYVSTHLQKVGFTFGTGETDLKRFVCRFGWLWAVYIRGELEFESRICEYLFRRYMGVK